MSINPLTLLEKAINEHGSSVILKERLELVKDQLAKVVAKNRELLNIQDKYHLLITENSKLKTDIENLKEIINKLEQPPSLSKDGLKILKYIADCNNLVKSSEIAEALTIKPVQADYHIQNLVDWSYIEQLERPISYDSKYNETVYSITQCGRQYLYENDLL